MWFVVVESVKMCNLPEEVCAYSKELHNNGKFMACYDCHTYLDIKDGQITKKKCPDVEGWGFNSDVRKCIYRSNQCYECNGTF